LPSSTATTFSAAIISIFSLLQPQDDELEHVILTLPVQSYTFTWAHVGKETGIFEQEGLDVEIVVSHPPATAVQAVIGGSAHFTATAESAVTAMLQGAELRAICYWETNKQAFLMARQDIQSVEDLRGRTVGVTRLRSQIHVVTDEILLAHGLTPGEDVEIVPIGDENERLAALQQGTIDASLENPPGSIIWETQGFKPLVSSIEVINRSLIGFLATSDEMVQEKPDIVKKMVRATILSVKRAITDEDVTTHTAEAVLGISEELAREAHAIFVEDWGYRPDPEDVQRLFEIQNSFLDEPIEFNIRDWLDYSSVNEILQEMDEEPLRLPGEAD
jgi:NitT/TauT family transport system substrate-binding protein